MKLTGDREYTDLSHRVLTQSRTVRFREMEYALPQDQIVPVFRAVQALIAKRGWRIEFPIEVRFAAADDRWLSTAHERASAYIALHRYWRHDPREYFDAVEAICLAHGGRPHWGQAALARRGASPRALSAVRGVRRTAGSDGPGTPFRNRYLERVLGA